MPSSKTTGPRRNLLKLEVRPDSEMVDLLTEAMVEALEVSAIEDETSPSDVVNAVLSTLDRVLRGNRKMTAPEDRQANADELNRIFNEFIADFGHLPS